VHKLDHMPRGAAEDIVSSRTIPNHWQRYTRNSASDKDSAVVKA